MKRLTKHQGQVESEERVEGQPSVTPGSVRVRSRPKGAAMTAAPVRRLHSSGLAENAGAPPDQRRPRRSAAIRQIRAVSVHAAAVLATIAVVSSVVFAADVDRANAAPGGGTSINHTLCSNGANRILEHAPSQLPVDVCFDDQASVLVVKNVAPYWIDVGFPRAVELRSRTILGVSDTTDAALALFLGTDGRSIPPGGVHEYDVPSDDSTLTMSFLFSTRLFEAETAASAILGVVGGDTTQAAQIIAFVMNALYGGDLAASVADLSLGQMLDWSSPVS